MSSALPGAVRSARTAKGLTVEALAFASGVSVATVQRTETGKHTPTLETLSAIAAALGTSPSELLATESTERAS